MSAIDTVAPGAMPVPPDAPRVVMPAADVYAQRAARFEQLAAAHGMGDWLRLMAALSHAQHALMARRAAPAVDATALEHSREHAMPPLATARHARPAGWRDDLDDLLAELAATPAAAPMCEAVAALDADAREALADRVVAGETIDADAAASPLVGAALQVFFSRWAASIDPGAVSRLDAPGVCPVCATRPLASVVHRGGDRDKLRYCVCALCATEWTLTRIQCSACQSGKSVHYLALTPVAADEASAGTATTEGSEAAQVVEAAPAEDAAPTSSDEAAAEAAAQQARRAEACDECGSYLKIFYRDKDRQVDPAADDLASLALDIAVQERGYGRSGPNLLLHPGSGE